MKCGIILRVPSPRKRAYSMPPTEDPQGRYPRHPLHMSAAGVEGGGGAKKPGPALTDPGQGGH
jgi:hypothetical protein